jgi:hypothetical protein
MIECSFIQECDHHPDAFSKKRPARSLPLFTFAHDAVKSMTIAACPHGLDLEQSHERGGGWYEADHAHLRCFTGRCSGLGMSKAVALGAIALYPFEGVGFPQARGLRRPLRGYGRPRPEAFAGVDDPRSRLHDPHRLSLRRQRRFETEIVRLKSTPPISFVRVSGPAGAVNYIAGRLAAATFKKDEVGVFFAPSHYPGRVVASATPLGLRMQGTSGNGGERR